MKAKLFLMLAILFIATANFTTAGVMYSNPEILINEGDLLPGVPNWLELLPDGAGIKFIQMMAMWLSFNK